MRRHNWPVLVGYENGITPPPKNGKCPTLTTELAHRTNSYGLPHVLVFGYIDIGTPDESGAHT